MKTESRQIFNQKQISFMTLTGNYRIFQESKLPQFLLLDLATMILLGSCEARSVLNEIQRQLLIATVWIPDRSG
jgi:hypothetical protein